MLIKNPKGQKVVGGKSFLLRDFKVEHLNINYKFFKDKVAAFYLKNKIKISNVKLVKLF